MIRSYQLSTINYQLSIQRQALALFDREAAAKKAVRDAQEALDRLVFAQYPKLTEDEIKILVVDDKWQATLKAAISAEIERVMQQLANRVKTLEERYAEPLPELVQENSGAIEPGRRASKKNGVGVVIDL